MSALSYSQVGLHIFPLGGLLHFSPLRAYNKEHQAHDARALVVLSLPIVVSAHKGFACCVRGTLFAVVSVHRLMFGVP